MKKLASNLKHHAVWIGFAIVIIAIIGVSLWLRSDANAAAPEFLNYQGPLNDNTGQPLNDLLPLEFNIYTTAQPVGGEQSVWGPFHFDDAGGEGHAARVNIINGRFNVVLGPRDMASRSIKDAFLGGGDRFIEIRVDGGAPILPRQQFLSAPYSIRANRADNGVPVGGIIPWWGNLSEMPNGFELCDGAAPTTPGARLSGNKPDLRNRFLRGAPNADTVVSDLGIGGADSHNLGHNHPFNHSHGRGTLHAQLAIGGSGTIRSVHGKMESRPLYTITHSMSEVASRNTFAGDPETRATAVAGNTSSHNGSTSSRLGSIDNKPQFREVYFIIRVD